MKVNAGAPRRVVISDFQLPSSSTLLLVFQYPRNTQFVISMQPNWWHSNGHVRYTEVNSVDAVRNGLGNTYHFDGTFLYVPVVQLPGNERWNANSRTPWTRSNIDHTREDMAGGDDGQVRISSTNRMQKLLITANCRAGSNPNYCNLPATSATPRTCAGFTTRRGYDSCTAPAAPSTSAPTRRRAPTTAAPTRGTAGCCAYGADLECGGTVRLE